MSLRTGLSNASEVTADVWRVQALAGDAEQEVDSRQSFEDTMPSPVRPIPDLGAGAASSTPFDEQPTMDSVAAFTVTLSALLPITHLTSSKLTRSPKPEALSALRVSCVSPPTTTTRWTAKVLLPPNFDCNVTKCIRHAA